MNNKNNKDLIFIDFPDADNFLKVLYSVKKNKNVQVFLTGRPIDFSYAPFYPKELNENFKLNPKEFLYTIDNKEQEKKLKNKYKDFKKWFNIDNINNEDTELLFKVNIIRLNKFLISQNIKNNTIKFFNCNKTHNIIMRHHAHKLEWAFDFDKDLKDEFGSIIEDWKAKSIPVSKRHGNKIRKLIIKYIEINKEYMPRIHDIEQLYKKYDTFLVGGPFTDVENVLKHNIKVDKIVAMAGAIYTGTSNDEKANIFPDQFNFYADTKAAEFVLSQDIEIILFPTESTKPWSKNNNGITFKTCDILKWNKYIIKLIEKYNVKDLLEYYKNNSELIFNDINKEFALFDLVIPIYYYNNIYFDNKIKQKIYNIYKKIDENNIIKNIILECEDNKHIIIKDNAKKIEMKKDNKYIIVGNLNQEDDRLLKYKDLFIKHVNKEFK